MSQWQWGYHLARSKDELVETGMVGQRTARKDTGSWRPNAAGVLHALGRQVNLTHKVSSRCAVAG